MLRGIMQQEHLPGSEFSRIGKTVTGFIAPIPEKGRPKDGLPV